MLMRILLTALVAAGYGANAAKGGLRQPPKVGRRQNLNPPVINATNYNNTGPVQLQISTSASGRNQTAPLLYGWMIEDISHSIDGGLYGELLVNRAFQGSSYTYGVPPGFNGAGEPNYIVSAENPIVPTEPTILGYSSIGGAQLSLTPFYPLSDELPISLKVDIPLDATGEVGFLNQGWWGMQVIPQTYNASFYILPYQARAGYTGLSGITISLRSNITGEVWVNTTIPADASLSGFNYTQLSGQLVNTVTAPDSNNSFAVTFDGAEVAGSTFYFNLISLFGETFNDRPNGMRKDLAQNIYDLAPRFLRFPGGNNIEGESVFTRLKWNETIGPLIHRKGRPGDWGYYNTNGFGLLEYLEWTEDMDMERVLAIYSGYSLDKTSYPEDQMGDVLQDALNEIEYCMGDTSTPYGALRAEHGHPDPFPINYVELGNEDFFSDSYPYRFPILYNGIKQAYPNITLIATAFNEDIAQGTFNYTIDIPEGAMWDDHQYQEPSYFLENFNYWDNWQADTNNTNVTVLIGEYSNAQVDTPDGVVNFSSPIGVHVFYPELLSAISEGVWLLGAERNPNTVKMSAYAPSLANLNDFQWTPDLISFTANPSDTLLSVSYYSQRMLNMYRGTETLPVVNTMGDLNPLWWVASIDEVINAVYLKVINTGSANIALGINFDVSFSGVNGTIITNPNVYGFNGPTNQTAILPTIISNLNQTTGNGSFHWSVPAYSISVLQFNL